MTSALNDNETYSIDSTTTTSSSANIVEAKVGEKISYDGVEISFLQGGRYTPEETFYDSQLKEGNFFVCAEFEVANNSSENINISSYNFTCYADDYKTEQCFIFDYILSADLTPGKKTIGRVYAQVPEGTEKIVFEFEDNIFFANRIVDFVLE